ncbi:MAG: hypothetical protein QOE48_4220 [Mycobacterium sp.]|jgi:hypothetical protein|nr:hypothetical protein [Mycobacterium sp.]MDT5308538.1 hypothetical protein [Mycobacterium sp.]
MTTTWVEALLRKQRETREHGVSPFPYQAAFLLDNPLRRTFFKPARVVESIGLTGSERVLELGPGPGFYSVEIARRLRGGRLDLFDRARPDRRPTGGFQLPRPPALLGVAADRVRCRHQNRAGADAARDGAHHPRHLRPLVAGCRRVDSYRGRRGHRGPPHYCCGPTAVRGT